MIYTDYGYGKINLIKTILEYQNKYNLNLNDISKVFGIKKESLINFLKENLNNNKISIVEKKLIQTILDSKDEESQKRRVFLATLFYEKEKETLKNFVELEKRSDEPNYEYTEKDFLLMTKYRILNNLSRPKIAEMLDISARKIRAFEDKIEDAELQRQLHELNEKLDFKNNPSRFHK